MFSKTFCGSKKIFSILVVLLLNLLLVSPALAAVNNNTNYVPLVAIPGVNADAGLLTYLSGLYNFLISVVGILAMAVIIYGGMRYLTSAGNPSSVEEAKDAITSAVTGLILALVSWLILSTINPDILVLKSVGVSGAGNYSYADAKNSCVANATGTGIASNECTCIDGEEVHAKSGAVLVPTVLTLTVSPNPGSTAPPGNTITLSGKLTDSAGKGVGGSIKINKVNTALNASTTFNATSGADGNFTTSYTATCAVTDQLQAVYAGDTTYAGSASTAVSLVINGMTACTTANYASSPATASITSATGGSACQSICSDTTLADDGAFHCLVVRPKISTVSDAAIMSYNKEQIRALAVYDGTADNPFVIPDKSAIVVDAKNNSVGVNTPITFTFDDDLSGECDNVTLPDGMWRVSLAYSLFTSAPACKQTITPKGITCSQKYCAKDSKGYEANSILYFTVLAPS